MTTISLTKLELKYKLTLFACIVLFMNIAFYFYLYTPQREEIIELNHQLSLQEQQIKVVESFIDKHPDITAYDKELSAKLNKIDKMMPENPDVSGFIDEISKLADKSSVKITNISPGKFVDKSNYRELAIELKISGDYFSILNFLKELDGLDRLTSVATVKTLAKGEVIESDLAVLVYCYGNSKAASSENAKAPKTTASKTN